MTYFPSVETTALTLITKDNEPVVELSLAPNNEHPQRIGRLRFAFQGTYPSEIETEPGPDAVNKPGTIIGQIMQWGPRTPDGTGRTRLEMTIASDPAGGLSGVIGSTTNDPSGSEGQKHAMPLVVNAGEGAGIYIAIYPSDNTIDFQDRVAGTSTGRIPLSRVIKHLRRIPK